MDALPPGYELPTARQVVGGGLQLALDHAAAIRGASLYIGLLILGVAGPAILLLLADLPALSTLPWTDVTSMTLADREVAAGVIGPLYVAAACALLGLVAVSIDGVLVAASVLASRAARHPLSLRESIQRARQVFWRYGFAAFVVGIVSTIASTAVALATGALGRPDSIGSNLLGSLVGAIVTAPFGYVLTAIVIGDVDGAAALGRSITLARARPRLAIVVAAFGFLSSTLQILGIGIAVDLAGQVIGFVDPGFDLAGPGLLVALPFAAAGLVAFGSLVVTVSAIAAAPQITAFLGLTHYAAGLERARMPIDAPTLEVPSVEVPSAETTPPSPEVQVATAPPIGWQLPDQRVTRGARWVTIPMAVLIGLEGLVAAAGIVAAVSR